MTGTERVVTRFAPSPTGDLHIGGARTALFCWAFARKMGGSFLIRIEDTDRARSSVQSSEAILKDLAWLGIGWDEGPSFTDAPTGDLGGDPRTVGPFEQSARLEHYNQHIDRLIQSGDAYYAFETPDEISEARAAAQAAKQTYRYNRFALTELTPEEREARVANGDPHVVRLRVPDDTPLVVQDQVLGEVRFEAGETEDFVIRKRDGFPTYHLAVVVDDALMGITHVLRGQEHLMNTPKHVALQSALGFETPVYAHMPLIFNQKGAKMSKRERDVAARAAVRDMKVVDSPTVALAQDKFERWVNDSKMQLDPDELLSLAEELGLTLPEVSVKDFEEAGYLPEVIVNFIGLLGWTPPKSEDGSEIEKFDGAWLCEHFALNSIGKSNSKFDRDKLLAFNTDAMTALDSSEWAKRWIDWSRSFAPEFIDTIGEDGMRLLAPALQPRSKTWVDASERALFAVVTAPEIDYEPKAVKKNLTRKEGAGLRVLESIRTALEQHSDWSVEGLNGFVQSFCESKEIGMGDFAQPVRVAVTGSPVSPPIAETLAVLGKDETLARMHRTLCSFEADVATG